MAWFDQLHPAENRGKVWKQSPKPKDVALGKDETGCPENAANLLKPLMGTIRLIPPAVAQAGPALGE